MPPELGDLVQQAHKQHGAYGHLGPDHVLAKCVGSSTDGAQTIERRHAHTRGGGAVRTPTDERLTKLVAERPPIATARSYHAPVDAIRYIGGRLTPPVTVSFVPGVA